MPQPRELRWPVSSIQKAYQSSRKERKICNLGPKGPLSKDSICFCCSFSSSPNYTDFVWTTAGHHQVRVKDTDYRTVSRSQEGHDKYKEPSGAEGPSYPGVDYYRRERRGSPTQQQCPTARQFFGRALGFLTFSYRFIAIHDWRSTLVPECF